MKAKLLHWETQAFKLLKEQTAKAGIIYLDSPHSLSFVLPEIENLLSLAVIPTLCKFTQT